MLNFFLRRKTDSELMDLIALGNSSALGELYERYSTKLLRYFFRMLWKDEAMAQDFLHDLFLKLVTHATAFDKGKNFSTWLYSIAHNMCKNEYRRQEFRKSQQGPLYVGVELPAVEKVLEEQEFRLALDNAISGLDADDRHLYALRYEVELSLSDIAQMLDCAEGTVKSRLFYLKKKLADRLLIDQTERTAYGTRQ